MNEAAHAIDDKAPAPSAWVDVGPNRVRMLRDGVVAFPAMLDAIAHAKREVLLEMYWFGADRIGTKFRDALVERARAGVAVRVLFDAIGSFGTPARFWAPLISAGGEVLVFSPLWPFHQRFRVLQIPYRDHRKILVVDGEVGFVGGINIGELWAPIETPETGWRDDGVEIHGTAADSIRTAFYAVWKRVGGVLEAADALTVNTNLHAHSQLKVLVNRIEGKPDRAIRRAYIARVRAAKKSIDIASAYFLPGPIFLHALRAAARRGVRVRILVPDHCDVLVAALAMNSLFGRMLADDIQIYAYSPRVLHAKTAVFDERYTTIGSHNLDSLSWRYDLECNVLIDSPDFAEIARASFEHDLTEARALSLDEWQRRPSRMRALAWTAALFRRFL